MNEPENSIFDRKTAIFWRGIRGRCPKCGEGKLFKSYLKPCEACPACGEDFSKLRVDDGTAWLTILLVGPIVVPVAMYLAMGDSLPRWMGAVLTLLITTLVVLLLLPITKGLFLSVLWLISKKN